MALVSTTMAPPGKSFESAFGSLVRRRSECDIEFRIRHLRDDDLPKVHEIFADPVLHAGTMRLPYPSLEQVLKRLERSEGIIRLAADADGDLAGFLELETYPGTPAHSHAADIHLIATHPDFRGKGVGRALMDAAIDLTDNWLQVSRVGLSVWTTNTSAISLYESYGFTIEGTMRRYVYRNGEYVDAYVMGRLRQP